MREGTGQLIGLFDADIPKVGDHITHEGEAWEVLDVAMLSGRWAAWGHRLEPHGTTVLIADDERDMRVLVRTLLEVADEGDLEVVAEAEDGAEAVVAWRGHDGAPSPDVVVLDNRMPHLSGLEAARVIIGERPEQIVVLYSAFLDDAVRAEAEAVGVAACVAKNQLAQLPDVIRTLLAA